MKPVRVVPTGVIAQTVRELFLQANTDIGSDVMSCLKRSLQTEVSDIGRYVLRKTIENAEMARKKAVPVCQDTGLAIVFAEIGQDVHIEGGPFSEAVERGVREAYRDGYFRKSVCDPLSRANTGDNTPAVIHVDLVAGDRIRITAMPKGGGSENMSAATMLLPADGEDGIRKHVVDVIRRAGPNPCPPVIVGVGIGGSLEKAVIISKKALLRPVGDSNSFDERLAKLEREILTEVNNLGIGPQGYGGQTTALAVHVEMLPCHIASLPVAVTIQCHAARHKEALI